MTASPRTQRAADPLRFVTLRALFAQELVTLRLPATTDRRRGAVAHARALINCVNEELDEIDEQHRLRLSRLADSAASVTDLALEMTSFLYAAGAPHPTWRRWSSLAALGNHLSGDYASAAVYAALAGERFYLDYLSTVEVPTRQRVHRALWQIIGGLPAEAGAERTEGPWADLAVAIPGGDAERTTRALRRIADEWLAMDDEWRDYRYRAFPCFDPALNAVAALARAQGITVDVEQLSTDQRAALEPGLAPGDPEPLYPRAWRV